MSHVCYFAAVMLGSAVVGAAAPNITAPAAADKPNIMLVVADDFGWHNSGWHAKDDPNVVTPTLNGLLAEGLELDRFYVYKVGITRLFFLPLNAFFWSLHTVLLSHPLVHLVWAPPYSRDAVLQLRISASVGCSHGHVAHK
jgi:hypothetical protein